MSVTPYVQTVEHAYGDPRLLDHIVEAQKAAAHRFSCYRCLTAISAGGPGIGSLDDAIDAQLDVVIAATGDGDPRLALYFALTALGGIAKANGTNGAHR